MNVVTVSREMFLALGFVLNPALPIISTLLFRICFIMHQDHISFFPVCSLSTVFDFVYVVILYYCILVSYRYSVLRKLPMTARAVN